MATQRYRIEVYSPSGTDINRKRVFKNKTISEVAQIAERMRQVLESWEQTKRYTWKWTISALRGIFDRWEIVETSDNYDRAHRVNPRR